MKNREVYPVIGKDGYEISSLRGRMTGEYRPVRKGEWYLSGAITACYRAGADTTDFYHVVKVSSYI